MRLEWEGVGRRGVLRADLEERRDAVADAARIGDWKTLLALLRSSPELVNSQRLEGSSLYAPLHQLAWHGGPVSVAAGLIGLGAWRTLRNRADERPLDVARRRGHDDAQLLQLLRPVIGRGVPAGVLAAIEGGFHDVIRGRASEQVAECGLRLPQLAPLLERGAEGNWWFPVPGMYGGFSYWFERDGSDALLVSESWCRVVGGSGERHEIDAAGSRLTDSGFV